MIAISQKVSKQLRKNRCHITKTIVMVFPVFFNTENESASFGSMADKTREGRNATDFFQIFSSYRKVRRRQKLSELILNQQGVAYESEIP